MLRKVIKIDEEKCDGCGQCVPACHEGAIEIIDGKARLVSDRYCDGLGDCLGECPQDAIELVMREAEDYDDDAVQARLAHRGGESNEESVPAIATAWVESATRQARGSGGCPGSAAKDLQSVARASQGCPGAAARALETASVEDEADATKAPSQLGHWPVQLRLLHPAAPYLAGSDMVLCADCVPFAYPDFHRDYLRDRTVAVSCPKLDDLEESVDRLTAIFAHARPRRVTVTRMMVPCCGGIAEAARIARDRAGVEMPIEIHTIHPQGGCIDRATI